LSKKEDAKKIKGKRENNLLKKDKNSLISTQSESSSYSIGVHFIRIFCMECNLENSLPREKGRTERRHNCFKPEEKHRDFRRRQKNEAQFYLVNSFTVQHCKTTIDPMSIRQSVCVCVGVDERRKNFQNQTSKPFSRK